VGTDQQRWVVGIFCVQLANDVGTPALRNLLWYVERLTPNTKSDFLEFVGDPVDCIRVFNWIRFGVTWRYR
jgi:hypothetical protein